MSMLIYRADGSRLADLVEATGEKADVYLTWELASRRAGEDAENCLGSPKSDGWATVFWSMTGLNILILFLIDNSSQFERLYMQN